MGFLEFTRNIYQIFIKIESLSISQARDPVLKEIEA